MEARPEESTAAHAWFLDGSSGTVSRARDHTRAFLATTPVSPSAETRDDALLVVSELVANAVRHAPGPCTLELAVDGAGTLTVALTDTVAAVPVQRTADLRSGGGGFGWNLLRRLTRHLDVHLCPDGGKTIRALLPLT
ncbi:ATP-binding protein [Streptacidiphilus cavernicola]|uniref:ATP-binding protein n=1 Tax=Streptacidiphilus cavernicola TaxID=3342716 RepID=A0ABV6VP19_9ACTN